MFGQNRFDGSDKKISINPLELLKVFQEGFEPNMERFGSALAVDYMKGYYKASYTFRLQFHHEVNNLNLSLGCNGEVHR
jgi:hypothetical protein